jgi:hypothetical protein
MGGLFIASCLSQHIQKDNAANVVIVFMVDVPDFQLHGFEVTKCPFYKGQTGVA